MYRLACSIARYRNISYRCPCIAIRIVEINKSLESVRKTLYNNNNMFFFLNNQIIIMLTQDPLTRYLLELSVISTVSLSDTEK